MAGKLVSAPEDLVNHSDKRDITGTDLDSNTDKRGLDVKNADLENVIGEVIHTDGGGEKSLRVILDSESLPISVVFNQPNTLVTNSVSAVPSGTDQIVVSYTVPVGKTFVLTEVAGTSNNKSRFKVEVDGSEVKRKSTYYTYYNVDFPFFGLTFSAGQVIRLKALHGNASASAEVQGSIIGYES